MADKKELNDFWDIEALIPEKRSYGASRSQKTSFDTSTSEVENSPATKNSDSVYSGSSFTRFIPPHTAEEFKNQPKPEVEYTLEHSLVHDVKIYSAENKYNFYDRFLDDARRFYAVKGEKSPPVPFFSYTPQYSQMNRAQSAYYFWWRENIRNGIYLSADYSYVILYVYELINLSEESDAEQTLDMMCNIWLRYGDEHPFVFKYLSEWVCDYCLIHRLPVPAEKIMPLYPRIMKECLIKEFYVVGGNGIGRVCADTLVEIASAYDYRKSKCATKDKLPALRKHLVGALDYVLAGDGESNPLLDGMRNNVADNTAVRTAYSGALCAGKLRRRIEIKYYSFSRSYELRYLISDVMKYSENKLRKIWGIKSRLNIYALPTSIKERVDEYFESLSSSFKDEQIRRERMAEAAAYEKLYDVPRTPLSLDEAAKIEENSWETTRILIETFDDESSDSREFVPKETKMPHESPNEFPANSDPITEFKVALGEKIKFLIAVSNRNVGEARRAAQDISMPAEAIADEINELAADMLGDVLIEENDGEFSIIDDYREAVEQMNEVR